MEHLSNLYECTDFGKALRFVNQHSGYLKAIDGSSSLLA